MDKEDDRIGSAKSLLVLRKEEGKRRDIDILEEEAAEWMDDWSTTEEEAERDEG